MRLRSVFLAGCIVLAAPGLIAAGYEAQGAAEAARAADLAARKTEVVAGIMQVATQLMVERGRWQDAFTLNDVHLDKFVQAEAASDAALDHAEQVARRAGLPIDFLEQTRASLTTVRARAGSAIVRRSSFRKPVEQYTRIIDGLDTAVAQLKRDVTLLDPQIGVILGLAETASAVRGIAGRRGVILNAWFAGQELAPGEQEELTLLTGKLSGAWEILQRGVTAAALPAKPSSVVLAAGDAFISTKEPWYRELVAAAVTGAVRPLQYQTFRSWHVTALGGLLPMRETLTAEAVAASQSAIADARSRLAIFLGIVVVSLGLVVGAVMALLRELVEPVRSVTNAMTTLAAGDLTGFVHQQSHLQEIASLELAVGVFRDALQGLHQQELDLRQANHRVETVLGSMVQGLCQYDAEDRLEVFNDQFSEMFGIAPGVMRPGLFFADVVQLAHEAGTFSDSSVQELIASRIAWHADSDASTGLLELEGGRVVSVSSSVMANGGWIATYQDVTEQRRSEHQLWHMARHDALTSLPNRVLLRERLAAITPHLRRGAKVAVLCLDLDGFKSINDTLGHPAGDELLRAVAERLGTATREVDFVARLGGDEFAIIQNDAEQPISAAALAERLVTLMRAPFELAGQTVEIGTSIGVVLADADAKPDELLRSADIALYQAKAGGRGTWRFFEPAMDAAMQARRTLELDLKRAVREEQFEVYYHPLVQAETRTLVGFEALLRWRHPERGMVSPAEFIPLTEETGLIRPIGAWALLEACKDALNWPDYIKVAVNLSPVQFTRGDLFRDVESALALSGLPAERLELEITESLLLQDNEATLTLLHRLRSLGVSISMDDFGTGYSSLSYLRSFPFNKIKIDQSFVRNLQHEKGGLEIVRAVVDLGRGLGMLVLAEGVETEEQFAMLRDEQCDQLQGYLFSRPVPARDIPRLLTSGAFVISAKSNVPSHDQADAAA